MSVLTCSSRIYKNLSHLPTITATSLMLQVVNIIIFVVIVSLFVIFISTSRIPIFPGIMSIEKPQIK